MHETNNSTLCLSIDEYHYQFTLTCKRATTNPIQSPAVQHHHNLLLFVSLVGWIVCVCSRLRARAFMVQSMEGQLGQGGCRLRAGLAGLPIGFRFRPTDEELLLHYLRRKAVSCPLPADIIPVADLARLHPWDLPGDADGERYFFHLPATRCWRKGGGVTRAGGTGVWRVSGKEKLVLAPRCKRPVGAKQTLVFCHRGGARTDWAMHEYRLLPAGLDACAGAAKNSLPHMSCHAAEAKDWVVCRIFKKTTPAHRGGGGTHLPHIRGTVRRRGDADMPSSPSSTSSCVTEACEDGGDGEEEEESSSSCCRGVASNWP